MKRLLVAVDGSEYALKGVRMAAEIASGIGASLELAYVSPPNLLPAQVYPELVKKLDEQEKHYAGQILDQALQEARAGGVETATVVRSGGPAEVLAELAAGTEVMMVVVGSRGRGAVSRVLLGSVADRLVQVCPKPVLVVR